MNKIARLLLASALMVPLLGTGCAQRRVVYAWGPGEQGYYVQWEHETHRQHMDWDRRSAADQQAYWKWRHHHHDHN